jgi:heme/copper-type cytochrome/quinol oxidase subunit 1
MRLSKNIYFWFIFISLIILIGLLYFLGIKNILNYFTNLFSSSNINNWIAAIAAIIAFISLIFSIFSYEKNRRYAITLYRQTNYPVINFKLLFKKDKGTGKKKLVINIKNDSDGDRKAQDFKASIILQRKRGILFLNKTVKDTQYQISKI